MPAAGKYNPTVISKRINCPRRKLTLLWLFPYKAIFLQQLSLPKCMLMQKQDDPRKRTCYDTVRMV